eukprot:c19614_g1_i4.p1 GENE.c19614_g1_i4~~c19614_g1_i4.p1  ORF type:complete len:582 (+),score=138.17 c19614_g1_i4:363-2108(+)
MYLGVKKEKKVIKKQSDRNRFVFDWEPKEDTSRDFNPLYDNKMTPQLLFGRGRLAGIDPESQGGVAYEKLIKKETESLRNNQDLEVIEGSATVFAKSNDSRTAKLDRGTHWSKKPLEQMTDRDWRIFKEDFGITMRGNNIPFPMRKWDESGLPTELLQAISRAGYETPSPIQMAAIPVGLANHDIIGVAETGSGKTCAFVLPMLVYIKRLPKMTLENSQLGPYALVMAPTRELAQQIEEETRKFATPLDFRVTSVVGGVAIEEQIWALKDGCEIIIATPGRINDCLDKRYLVLAQCNYVVLDEADRMIDMGFEPQVQMVLDAMPATNLKPMDETETDHDHEMDDGDAPQQNIISTNTHESSQRIYRQTFMFSATMPPAVERLARTYLRQPAYLSIGSKGQAAASVEQKVAMMLDKDKPNKLQEILRQFRDQKVIVFANTKKSADVLSSQIHRWGFSVTALHGGKSQDQREYNIAEFRSSGYNVLVATDVAARGIDIPDVNCVVNYEMPNSIESYTHRIGRTGRAGRSGVAHTFITAGDSAQFYDLKNLLTQAKQRIPPELARHEASFSRPGTTGDMRPITK